MVAMGDEMVGKKVEKTAVMREVEVKKVVD